jgi:DNA polymerase (family X)
MINQEIANILFEIGYFLEMEEAAFRPQAYEKAAIVLENVTMPVDKMYAKGGLKALIDLPGIGENIAKKIVEYLETGKIEYHEKWKKRVPVDMEGLMAIEGVGPKRIKRFYEELCVTNKKELALAAKEGLISKLPGFGKMSEKNILENIKLLKTAKNRVAIEKVLPIAEKIKADLNRLKEVEKISFAGSVRRKKDTVGDVDILVVTRCPEKVMNEFVGFEDIVKVWGKGITKSSVRMKQGFDVDLRVVPQESYGAALQYFTGSMEHNIEIRKLAISKGYKLNEYGLFEGSKKIAGDTEKSIYDKLGLEYPKPEKR